MKNWRAIVGVIGVFVLGMAAGGLLMGGVVAKRLHRVARGDSLFTAEEITRRLSRSLALDAGQREQVLVIVRDAQAQIKDTRRQCEPQIRATIDASITKARAVLRPDQAEKFDRLVADRKARW